MLLLKATEDNWNLIAPGDWEQRKWTIRDDGWYQYTTSFRSGDPDEPELSPVTKDGQMTISELQELINLLNMEWSSEITDACDGTAWEFKMFQNGKVIKHRETDYIYGIEPYESIVRLLESKE